jgi:UDP-N-acetylmuramoyl-L-alanyl-D-glutamate--2,6-diaminopimelate ligase
VPCPRTLVALARLLDVPPPALDALVTGVTHDSRAVVPGTLYAALPGAHRHGAEFAAEARRRGAVAALSDRPLAGLPTLVVPDPRRALGPVAAAVHGDPSLDLAVHAVTGTNGKTSTVHLLEAGLAAAGRRPGLLSTVVTRGFGSAVPSVRTTPEAPEVQAFLARMRDAGCTDVALEASSHGLDLHRLDGIRFRTGIFTNLSRDHLDHHGDMEQYFCAKASLFTPERCRTAVVSVDDEWGRRLAASTRCPVVTFSGRGHAADWRATSIRTDVSGTRFRLLGPGVDRTVRLRLLGPHQVDNALGALAALAVDGVPVPAAVRGLEALRGIPGRLERVDVGQPFSAFVDYAHNSGAQERVLDYLRSLSPGRLVVVAGAAGERDLGKRRLLARAAAAASDLLVITDESPYGEDPRRIRADLLEAAMGTVGRGEVVVVPDRRDAFEVAVDAAQPGDTVFVGGRGHERWLSRTGHAPVEFDDLEQLRDVLEKAVPSAAGPSAGDALRVAS